MTLRNLFLTCLLGGTVLALGCKDDPLVPTTKGNLRIVVTFDTTAIPVTRVGDSAAAPNAVNPPDGGPSFDFAAITSGEVWILQDGSTVQNFTLTLQGSELRGTSSQLDAGRYQLVVAGIEAGLVTYYGEGAATVVAGQDGQANVSLQNFTPVAIVSATTVSIEAPVRWSLAGGASRDEFFVQFADNAGFTGSRDLRVPSTQLTATFPVGAPGTYYTRVRAENQHVGTRGVFSAVVTTTVMPDTIPSGDGSGSAPLLGFGANLSGTNLAGLNVLPAGDVDWFAFGACALDLVSVTLKTGTLNPASGLDASLQLYNADGSVLLGEDQSTGQVDKVVSLAMPGSGTYNLAVGARTTTNAIGEYQLQIQVTPGAITDTANEQCIFQADPIVYVSDEDGDWEIFLRNADGSQVTQLTANTDVDILPLWSPDGSRVLFSRFASGNWDTWVMDADGSNQVNLTNSTGANDFGSAWHPDGTRIALRSSAPGGVHDIYVMASNGSGMVNFSGDPTSNQDTPWFTPDGSAMVYTSDEDGDFELFIVNTDGANKQRLTNNSGFEDNQPRVSPDGSRIAYFSNQGGSQSVWVMDIDGSNAVDLTGTLGGGTSVEFVGNWSPDGTQIIVETNAFGSDSADFDVVVINADGSGSPIPIAQAAGFQGFGDWQNPRSVASDLMTVAAAYPDTVFLHATDVAAENRFTLRVDNAGNVAYLAGGNLTVDLWVNDDPSFSVVSDAQLMASASAPNMIPAGESRQLSDVFMPAVSDLSGQYLDPGQLYFMAEVDPGGVISESDETNNRVTFSAWGAYRLPTVETGMLYRESVATGGGGNDTLDLYVSEDAVSRGLLVSVIPDVGSAVDPILDLRNSSGAFGGDQNNYTGTVTATAVAELGNGRPLDNGELVAIPVIPAGGALRTSIAIGAHLTGDYQLNVQRCELVDLGTAAAGGVAAGEALSGTDCTMWPNPVSGSVTYARMYSITAAAADEVRIALTSTDFDPVAFLFDPDGRQYFFGAAAGSGTASLLETLWTPGTWTVLATSSGEFSTGNFDLTVTPVVNTGTPIVFAGVDGGGNSDIYVRSPDGLTFTNLTNDPANDREPEWSPDGTQLAFVSNRDGGGSDIYVMGADGSNIVNLTNNSGSTNDRPSWSPDQSRIVFHSDRDGSSKLYVMNADGTNLWTFAGPGGDETSPAFTPDGSRVVFSRNHDGDFDILARDLNGANEVQFTHNTADDGAPVYSPDGNMIAWHSDVDGSQDVWVMNSDGTNQVNLTGSQFASTMESNPSWSADGSQIVFVSDFENPGSGFTSLYRMNADGTLVRRVSDGVTRSGEPDWQKPRNLSADLVTTIVTVPDTLLIGDAGELNAVGPLVQVMVSNGGAVAAHVDHPSIPVDYVVSQNATFGDGDDETVWTGGVTNLLRPGQTDTGGAPFLLDPNPSGTSILEYGTNYLRAIADPQDFIAESDEGNNYDDSMLQFGLWLQAGDADRRRYIGNTGAPLGDMGDLIVDEVSAASGTVGLIVSAIPDIGSGIDPMLDIRSTGRAEGGVSLDNIHGVTTNTAVAELGTGRTINGGELFAFTVAPDPTAGYTRTSITVSGANGTQGSYQLNVQRCPLVDLGDVSALGAGVTDSVRPSECVMWPNPLSGGVTYARMYTFSGDAGDAFNIDLLSTEFDATLHWFNPGGRLAGQSDDDGAGTNARFEGVSIADTGPQTLVVSSYDETVEGQFQLVVSPVFNTGTEVAFTGVDANGQIDIYRRSGDGLAFTNLTNSASLDQWPVWSPDGTRIVFQSDRDNGSSDVYVMNVDGSNVVNLTNSPGSADGRPNWSPDGNRIAFTSDRDGNREVYLMNADGSGLFNLSSSPGVDETGPVLSPDGSQLLYYSNGDGDWEVVALNLDGSAVTQLTNNSSNDIRPRYSPDGSRIAWASNADGSYDIWVMNSDGSNPVNVTGSQFPGAMELNPAWSPDGTQLVFTSDLLDPGNLFTNLYVVNADGSDVRRISNGYTDSFHPNWQNPVNVAADLVISTVTAHDTLFVGDGQWQTVGPRMEALVTNVGQVAAFAPSDVPVDWTISRNGVFGDPDDETPIARTVPSLIRPGEAVSTGLFDFDPDLLNIIEYGRADIRVTVDPDNAVPESNETNNSDAFLMPIALWLQDGDVARRLQTGTNGSVYDDASNDLFVDEVHQDNGLLISLIEDIGSSDDPFLRVSGASFGFGERNNNDISGIVTNTGVAELGNGRTINGGELTGFPIPGGSGQGERIAVEVASDVAYQIRIDRCDLTQVAIGDSVGGTLASDDCKTWPNLLSGAVTYGVMFSFDAQVGDQLIATAGSGVFDPVVIVFGPNGDLADASGAHGQATAAVTGTVTDAGTHVVLVTTWGEMVTGDFWLTVRRGGGGGGA